MFKALSIPKFAVQLITVALLFSVSSNLLGATTGKIAGQVVDGSTGDPIPGANVLIAGTSLGGATDVDGQYFIINIPPGTYTVRVEVIGFETIVNSNVRVLINLTTTIDFAPQVEAVAGQAVEVTAIRPVVQPDVSANVANIRAEEMEFVPVAGITEFINLQAGIEPGMRIRGAGTDALSFVVDGSSMRDGRSNRPFSAISYTAIQEVQIQTGGFNAEYGNVRSGLINVVTKDPPRDRYIADVLLRYAPPQELSFGGLANDPNAYYWRPYMDPAVAFIGTHDEDSPWDKYTQNQYPAFVGWNQVAKDNILSAEQLQEVFEWHTRKDLEITDAEFDIDATIGGPLVPGGGLGGLRFLASYRSTQDPYFFPQARRVYTEVTTQLKLMADLGPSMRLTISGLQGKQSGTANQASSTVVDEMPQLGGIPSYPWSSAGFTTTGEFSGINMLGESGGHLARSTIYGTDRYAVTDVTRNQIGAALTHTLNPRTFYKVSVNWMQSNYDSGPDSRRDELKNEFVNNGNAVMSWTGEGGEIYYVDTAPFGWTSSGTSSPGSGLRLGGHWARARDASWVTLTTLKFDLTNQTTQFSSLKAGVEIIRSNFDMDYGSDDSVIVHLDRSKQKWKRSSTQAAFYVQDKLEFKGMIANVGLRLDSFNPGGDWWVYEDYDRQFVTKGLQTRDTELEKKAIEGQLTLSPRVGVSFPITTDSKLFFNYGHFRDVLAQRELYQIQTQWLGNIGNLGDPNQPLLKTVSYELGYEQNILDQYLLRLSGYYNDRSNQPGEVNFVSIDGAVNYNVTQARNYGDTRGVEITLNKTRGQWFRGFINYTFMTEKSGNFGFRRQYENPVEESDYVRTSTEHYQNTPVSMPFARTDLEFIAPATLGLLGDWRLNLLAGWRAGQVFTWDGGGQAIRGLSNNVRQKNFTSLDLRLSKNFQTGLGRAQFFVDITNVLNLRHMYFNSNARQPFEAFDDERPDWLDYMWSLHMDVDVFEDIDDKLVPYTFIAGDDRPGDFRKDGVAFVPIEVATDIVNLPTQEDMGTLEDGRRVLGWVADGTGKDFGKGTYFEYNKATGKWDPANSGFVDDVLDDRAYINMPNEIYRTFLNPRKFLFGIRVWF